MLGNVSLSKLQSTLSARHTGDEWEDCVRFCLVLADYKRMLVQCSTLCRDGDHLLCVCPPNLTVFASSLVIMPSVVSCYFKVETVTDMDMISSISISFVISQYLITSAQKKAG